VAVCVCVCVCSASPGPLRQRLGGSNFAARPRCEVCYEKRRQWRRNNFINFADIPLSSAQVRLCVCAHKCRWNNASVCVAVLALLGRPAIVCLKVFHTPKSTMSALWLYRLIFLLFFFQARPCLVDVPNGFARLLFGHFLRLLIR